VSGCAERWFVTTNAATSPSAQGQLRLRGQHARVHAKRMGSTTTACGLSSDSWAKHYALAFPGAGVVNCRDCMGVVYDISSG
jgi:hypothetical protein